MNMAKELKISLGLVGLFLGFLGWQIVKNKQTEVDTKSVILPITSSTTFSLNDVAKHNKATDCWFVINNNVYNVTDYASQHPGGVQNITDYCGKDATIYYKAQRKHGVRSDAELVNLLVGSLK